MSNKTEIKVGNRVKLKSMDKLRCLYTLSKSREKDLIKNQEKIFKIMNSYYDDALKGSNSKNSSVLVLQLDKFIFSDIDKDTIEEYKDYINAEAVEVIENCVTVEEQ